MKKYSSLDLDELESMAFERGVYIEPEESRSLSDFAYIGSRRNSGRREKLITALVQRDNHESPMRANRLAVIALIISGLSLLVAGAGVLISLFMNQTS